MGQTADLEELTAHLTEAGYVRCEQVEGPGQFALRGGILDVYSPAMEAPVRAEFFGDEVDALGIFDPVTQRRTANVEQAVLLPAAETLPHLAPGGLAGLLKQLDQRSAAAVRDGLEELAATLRAGPGGPGGGAVLPGSRPVSPPNLSGAGHRGRLSPL